MAAFVFLHCYQQHCREVSALVLRLLINGAHAYEYMFYYYFVVFTITLAIK